MKNLNVWAVLSLLVTAGCCGTSPDSTAGRQAIAADIPAKPAAVPLPWHTMADEFDAFIMDPANGAMKHRPDGNPFFPSDLQGASDELTTFGVVFLGKTLRGTDVSALRPSFRAFFNDRAGLFCNVADGLKIEHWYLLNVDALAAAIVRTSFDDPEYLRMQRSTADALIRMAENIGYDFNDQGYDFGENKPWTNKDIYRQPDVIGGYAYQMLMSYEMLGDRKYLDEAKKAIGMYQSFERNPWYEIPSGAMAALAAARLKACHGADGIDCGKILSFALDPRDGALQTGTWGGAEVNGLMRGWGNGDRNEAYSMESLVAPMYILPSLRYNTEYAAEVGKYFLNLAANMRPFYSQYLPRENQSRPDLPDVMPYERLAKEDKGATPYAGGDYGSQRSIYGGGYVMWMGEIVRPTGDPYILRTDISKTDFLTDASYPTYLYYNPYETPKSVTLELDGGTYDIYETIRHRTIRKGVSGSVSIDIPASGATIVAVVPAGAGERREGAILYRDGIAVDYNVK